jgi:hypothetical protein
MNPLVSVYEFSTQLFSVHQSTGKKKIIAAIVKTQDSQDRQNFIFSLVQGEGPRVQ